jgi:hypothetical protein
MEYFVPRRILWQTDNGDSTMENGAAKSEEQPNLYDRLDNIRMSDSDRQLAKASLRNVERIFALIDRVTCLARTMNKAFANTTRRWLALSRQ